jgi:hypothetical protein
MAHAFCRLEKHVVQRQCGKLLIPFDGMQIITVPDTLRHAQIMPRDTSQRHRGFHILSVPQNANAANVLAPRLSRARKQYRQFRVRIRE